MSAALTNDARNRALRTFLQGLGADVAAALVLLLLPAFTNANGWGDFEWQVLGFLVVKTVAVTALSYVMRQYLDGSSVPTPLPPANPGEPDASSPDETGAGDVLYLLAVVVVVLVILALVGVI